MAAKGWRATGLLQPLWAAYPGGRDALAQAIGTTGSALSSRNSGERNLGVELARKLAGELGVSLAELGAPEDADDDLASRGLLDRLESLADRVAYLLEREADLSLRVHAAEARLAQIESERTPGRDAPTGQARR